MTHPATLDHTLFMLTSLLGRCIGVSALVCVLLMFLFPLPHGNFQSTHGPVTALRSKRAFLVIAFSIMKAALQTLALIIPAVLLEKGCVPGLPPPSLNSDSTGCNCVLRC